METEVRMWLARYPVPLMATAFSADGDVLSLKGVRPIDNLMAWLCLPETEPVLRWELVANAELPDIALDREFVEGIFANIPSKTGRDIQEQVAKDDAVRKTGWRLVFVWAVVVPLGVAILEWWSDLLGLVVLGYESVAPAKLKRTDTTDEKAKKAGLAAKTMLEADKEAGRIVLDSETALSGIPPEAWEYKLGNRSALEWILDQYKESKPKDPTIREKVDTYRFADYKDKVIDLLMRVTTVSVRTVAITRTMNDATR